MLDSNAPRIECPALLDGIPKGHYKVTYAERLDVDRRDARRQRYGPGRLFIADLNRRDVASLVASEKAQETIDDDRIRVENRVAAFGSLNDYKDASIHGGGESLSRNMSVSNFQPLTPSNKGIRVHNSDLGKLLDYLKPRLHCEQLVVFTIC